MLLRHVISLVFAFSSVCLMAQPARAGMPSPHLVVTELGKRRLEEMSFFLMGFLLLAAICRWLWNGLAKDVPSLPKLSYRGALCMMLLWGLALTVVLSLVSGARELMTPAAWEPNGITHRLAGSTTDSATAELAERRTRMDSLKMALWNYAASHDAQFPYELSQLSGNVSVADEGTGLPYILQPDLKLSSPRTILAAEPDIHEQRLLLLTDGAIVVEERREGRKP